jgi:hypothetical protein
MRRMFRLLILMGLVAAVYYYISMDHPQFDLRPLSERDPVAAEALKKKVAEELRREEAVDTVAITDFHWTRSDFGLVMIDLTIRNPSDVVLKDIVIGCIFRAPSGTVVDQRTTTIYEIVRARGAKSIKNFQIGIVHSQASKADRRVRGASPMAG